LLTGAAGGLGRVLRPRLRDWAHAVRISDRDDCGAADPGEEIVRADLADAAAVHELLEGVDAVPRWALQAADMKTMTPDELKQRIASGLLSFIKAGVRLVGHDAGPVRAPLTALADDEVRLLRSLVDAAGGAQP